MDHTISSNQITSYANNELSSVGITESSSDLQYPTDKTAMVPFEFSIKDNFTHTETSLAKGLGNDTGNRQLESQKILPSLSLEETDLSIESKIQSTESKDGSEYFSKSSEKKIPAQESSDWTRSAKNISLSIFKGAANEVTENYTGIALTGVSAFAVGFAAAAFPAVATGVAIAGLGFAAHQVIQNGPKLIRSANVLANPERFNTSQIDNAQKDLNDFGAGLVHVTVGIIGGVAGNMAGNFAFAPIRLDSAGRPTKLPLPDERGSAYIKYDRNGEIISYTEKQKSGWTSVLEQNKNLDGSTSWTNKVYNYEFTSTKQPWQGSIKLDQKGLSISDGSGITILRTDGTNQIIKTGQQQEFLNKLKQDFQSSIKDLRSSQKPAQRPLGVPIMLPF